MTATSGIFVSLCTGLDMQIELDRLLPEITFAFRKLKMSNTLPYLKKKNSANEMFIISLSGQHHLLLHRKV